MRTPSAKRSPSPRRWLKWPPLSESGCTKIFFAVRNSRKPIYWTGWPICTAPFQPDGIFAVLAGAVDDSYDGNPDELMGDLYRRLSQELQPSVSCQPYSCEYLLMDDYSLVLISHFPIPPPPPRLRRQNWSRAKSYRNTPDRIM